MALNFVYKGAVEICEAVGLNPRDIAHYVRTYDLPAWKINGKGTWRALEKDLVDWIYKMRNRYLGRPYVKPAKTRHPFRVLTFKTQGDHSLPRSGSTDEAG